MPIYTYVCNECDKIEDEYQVNHEEKESKKFEGCDKESCSCKKLMNANVAVHYKGTGFFTTDYKKK